MDQKWKGSQQAFNLQNKIHRVIPLAKIPPAVMVFMKESDDSVESL